MAEGGTAGDLENRHSAAGVMGIQIPRAATAAALAVLSAIAVHSLWLAVQHGLFAAWGGGDFHAYWYYGHFVRQGVSPYHAVLTGTDIALPVTYLDGVTAQQVPAQLSMMPANTAPMMLLLSLFSWLSWPVAKAAWLGCNVLFALTVPWLAIRILPDDSRLSAASRAAICLIFYGLYSTRVTLEMGQTTIVVLLLMLASIRLADRRWLLSGLCLGIALSKYSLAFPAFVLLVGARRGKVVLTSLAVQAAGMLGVSLLGSGRLSETAEFYRGVLRVHAGQQGMHVLAQLPVGIVSNLAVGICTIAIVVLLGIWAWRQGWMRNAVDLRTPAALHLFNLVGLLTLLAIYHRGYDAAFVVVTFALALWEGAPLGGRSRATGFAGLLFWAAAVLTLTLPTAVLRVIFAVFGAAGRDPVAAAESLISLTVLALFGVSFYQMAVLRRPPLSASRRSADG